MINKISLEKIVPPEGKPDNEAGIESLSEEERKAWRLLVPAYKNSAIKPESFKKYDQYDRQAIQRDLKAVQELERKISEESSREHLELLRRSELLEALLNEQISTPATKWLGKDTESIPASRYDDIFNGVDLIIEILREEGFRYLGLNIDVTSSSRHLSKKISEIKENITKGRMSGVKYFQSKKMQPQFTGELSGFPKVVIGIDPRTIRELSLLRVEYATARKGAVSPQNNPAIQKSLKTKADEALRRLAKHRVQFLIIKEVEIQLETFAELARKFAPEKVREKLAKEYEAALATIFQIKKSKQNPENTNLGISLSPEDEDLNNNDQVYQSLIFALKDF